VLKRNRGKSTKGLAAPASRKDKNGRRMACLHEERRSAGMKNEGDGKQIRVVSARGRKRTTPGGEGVSTRERRRRKCRGLCASSLECLQKDSPCSSLKQSCHLSFGPSSPACCDVSGVAVGATPSAYAPKMTGRMRFEPHAHPTLAIYIHSPPNVRSASLSQALKVRVANLARTSASPREGTPARATNVSDLRRSQRPAPSRLNPSE